MLISGDGTLADDLKVIGAFIGGLVLIALELVTPGIGIFGVAGILLLFGSLFWMLGATVQAVYILAGGIVIAVILFYILGRHGAEKPAVCQSSPDHAVYERKRVYIPGR
jgi:membrane-bound serine protease (ClpP class)